MLLRIRRGDTWDPIGVVDLVGDDGSDIDVGVDATGAAAAALAAAKAYADAGLVGKQAGNANLTVLAGLDPTQVGVIVSDGAGWLRKSVAQFRAWLGLAAVAVTGAYADLTGAPDLSLKWAAGATLAVGDRRRSPDGWLLTRKTAGVSAASFVADLPNWRIASATLSLIVTNGVYTLPLGIGAMPEVPAGVTATNGSYTVQYVDGAAGNDANNGNDNTHQKLTFASALSKLTALGLPGIILVKPGATPLREIAQINLAPVDQYGVALYVASQTPGTQWSIYGSTSVASGWTTVGGGIYSQAFAANPRLVAITDMLDNNGFQQKLSEVVASGATYPQVVGTPTTPGPGQFGYSGGLVYVNLPDGSDPATHTIEMPRYPTTLQQLGAGPVVVVDGISNYTTTAGWECGGSGSNAPGMFLVRCTADYHGLNGGFNLNTIGGWMVCLGCRSRRGNNDGFAPTTNIGVLAAFVEVGCESAYNDDQGSSAHQSSAILRVGGRYHDNYDGGVVDVQNVYSVNLGIQCDRNTFDAVQRAGHAAGIDFYDSTVAGFVDDCDLLDNYGAGMTLRLGNDVAIGRNRSGLGFGNSAPDQLAINS